MHSFLAFSSVPKVEPFARRDGARATDEQAKPAQKDLSCRIQAKLATRGNHRHWQNSEAAALFQCDGEVNLLACEIPFIKSRNGEEILPVGEKECARAQICAEVDGRDKGKEPFTPGWNSPLDRQPGAATSIATIDRLENALDVLVADARIRIDKDEDFPNRGASAGIARGRNLSAFDVNYARAESLRDVHRFIARRIIYHDYFITVREGGAVDCLQRLRQFGFFIVGWNNERNPSSLTRTGVVHEN